MSVNDARKASAVFTSPSWEKAMKSVGAGNTVLVFTMLGGWGNALPVVEAITVTRPPPPSSCMVTASIPTT